MPCKTARGNGRSDAPLTGRAGRRRVPVERAGLFLALVAGMQVIRQMVEIPSLAQADPATLEALLLLPIVRQLAEAPGRQ